MRLFLLVSLAFLLPFAAPSGAETVSPAVSDSLYQAHHPRLLFTPAELPALRSKVLDGGYDAEAYEYIHHLVERVYANETEKEFLDAHDFGIGDVPNLGVFAFIEQPMDSFSLDLGRRVTNHLVDSTGADDNAFYGSLRLRSLAFGYDMFFHDASPEERGRVRLEIETYIDTMLVGFWHLVWKHRPYLSNMTTMIAGSIGLASIALDGETDPARVEAGLTLADDFIDTWLTYQMDPDGSYKEGGMYAGWCMRHLVYYFWARKRFDGYDWAGNPRIRNMEKWVAFSMLPVGVAEVNNLNDTASRNYPYSRHHAYFDYAQTAWNSGLSRWLWERILGPHGHDSGRLKGPAATVLWSRDITPTHPCEVLPNRFMWSDRGLYYFRTGWPEESLSDDVVFSFYSGMFHGGHSQEDQNSFTLYGYGERFAIDSGFLHQSWESEAHNVTFVDGKGQHHSGGSVGTDGRIAEYLMGGFADYIFGDATRAYTIHSDFNLPDVPFPGMDWSFGYDGGNPVEFAHRRFIIVHGGNEPPYFVLVEDIQKDDTLRTYDWRMHTDEAHDVDASTSPIRITGDTGYMDLHVLSPAYGELTPTLSSFDNGHDDPNSTVIVLSLQAQKASFAHLFMPAAIGVSNPPVATANHPWGIVSTIAWPGGDSDVLTVNRSAGIVSFNTLGSSFSTDAGIAVLRVGASGVEQHILTTASFFSMDGTSLVEIADSAASVSVAIGSVHLDRDDIHFRIYAPRATEVLFRDETVPFVRDGDYVVADTTVGGPTIPPRAGMVTLRVYPSPFRVSTTIAARASTGRPLEVSVFDTRGRLVKTLTSGNVSNDVTLTWRGTDAKGNRVAVGVYFVRAESAGISARRKVVIVR